MCGRAALGQRADRRQRRGVSPTERFASTREELTAAVIGLAKRMRLDRAGEMAGSPAMPA